MAIPKVIHYCWFGGTDLPDAAKKCIASWKVHCPDYEIIRWDETNYDYSKYCYAKEAYDQKKWAFVSDVARLDIIYHYGGIYLDTDVELVKSLDILLGEPAFMGFEQGRLVNTGLGFGGEKGNFLIKENLDTYQNRQFIKDDGSLDLTPCTVITTSILDRYGLVREDKLQVLDQIKIFPSDYFSPMLLSDGNAEITENTFSIHHFVGSWTTDLEKRKVKRRREVYTRWGRKGLRVYDGLMLLKQREFRLFFKRLTEIISGK